MYDLDKVGVAGSANPHFGLDWIDVEIDTNEENFDQTNSFENGQCSFPSVHVVNLYFQKIGEVQETQHIIKQMTCLLYTSDAADE